LEKKQKKATKKKSERGKRREGSWEKRVELLKQKIPPRVSPHIYACIERGRGSVTDSRITTAGSLLPLPSPTT
jgi:hypothetical protein